EIQLNGKQLVFLFMAATVVSVVIFLCGVLVGRGVRAERAGAADTASAESLTADPAPAAAAGAPAAAPADSDPTKAAPPPEAEDLSYFTRLEQQNAPAEKLKPAESHDTPAPTAKPAAAAPAQAAAAAPPAMKPAAAASSPAPASGYAVQVA